MRMVSALAAAIVAVSLASCERRETEDLNASMALQYSSTIMWQDLNIDYLNRMASTDEGQRRTTLLTDFCTSRRDTIARRDQLLDGRAPTMSIEAARLHFEVNEICQGYVTN